MICKGGVPGYFSRPSLYFTIFHPRKSSKFHVNEKLLMTSPWKTQTGSPWYLQMKVNPNWYFQAFLLASHCIRCHILTTHRDTVIKPHHASDWPNSKLSTVSLIHPTRGLIMDPFAFRLFRSHKLWKHLTFCRFSFLYHLRRFPFYRSQYIYLSSSYTTHTPRALNFITEFSHPSYNRKTSSIKNRIMDQSSSKTQQPDEEAIKYLSWIPVAVAGCLKYWLPPTMLSDLALMVDTLAH